MPLAARYSILIGVLALAVVIIQFAVHAVRTEPRDTRAMAVRELQLNTLAPGERVLRMVSVFKRPMIDYFRATRGLLVLTDKRLLFLGLQPRDLLAAPDMPPMFEEHDFPLDTLVRLRAGRTFIGVAHAIVITTPSGTTTLGVTEDSWPTAQAMLGVIEARHAKIVSYGVRQKELLARANEQRRIVEAERRRPKHYTVARGDALASIAARWNTTPDRLREWNRLTDYRIRVGQVLLVRPAT
jgi:LysM domain